MANPLQSQLLKRATGPFMGIANGIGGMVQNRGALSNIGHGFTAGAGIGSIVPGIGTLIGGGIGALAGGIESLFNIGKPSQQELQGRQTQGDIISRLVAGATPQQRQEAQQGVSSGAWKDLNSPLSIIMARDSLMKSGDPNADQHAQAWVKSMWNAEKQGPQAVYNAASFNPMQRPSQPAVRKPAQPTNGYQY